MSGQNFGAPKCQIPARDIPANFRIAGAEAGARLPADGSLPARNSREFRRLSAQNSRTFWHF
jgi:hypothetical protein